MDWHVCDGDADAVFDDVALDVVGALESSWLAVLVAADEDAASFAVAALGLEAPVADLPAHLVRRRHVGADDLERHGASRRYPATARSERSTALPSVVELRFTHLCIDVDPVPQV